MTRFKLGQDVIKDGRKAKIISVPARWFRGPINYAVQFIDGTRAIVAADEIRA